MSFDVPKVMGILNLTPDSFYEGNRKTTESDIFALVEKMVSEGADIIDVGAISTRPGSQEVSVDEEKKRLLTVLPQLCERFPDILFSVDTFRAEIAEKSVACGASIINDISGGMMDEEMPKTIAKLQVPYILMHMRGTPQTMTKLTHYDKFPEDVISELSEKIRKYRLAGVNDIVVDPGFGFAKTIEQNFGLFDKLEHFQCFGAPVLVGISRKKTIYQTLGTTAGETLNGTTYLHAIALEKGADILRVHDVKAAVECIKLHVALKKIPL
jgi:dihydropteroate synthase